jgi:hypothetical protein
MSSLALLEVSILVVVTTSAIGVFTVARHAFAHDVVVSHREEGFLSRKISFIVATTFCSNSIAFGLFAIDISNDSFFTREFYMVPPFQLSFSLCGQSLERV